MSTGKCQVAGVVFNIQKYSVHDGPGIRTIVFLKGCPLTCRWCSNPESQQIKPELAYNRDKCLTFEQCVRCLEVCAPGAIQQDDESRARIDRQLCSQCLLCAEACPSKALIVYGEERSVAAVIDAVEEDGAFYSRSGGGLTLSGGEPLHQPEFAMALLAEARRRRINTALETCGHCRFEDLAAAAAHLNTLLYDIKHMNSKIHHQYTGSSNERILDNLTRLRQAYPDLPILVRTPVIPGVNDSEEAIAAIVDFIAEMPNVRYEMLPYHRLGKPKYAYLGRSWPMDDIPSDDDVIVRLQQMVRRRYPHLIDTEPEQRSRKVDC